MNATTTCLLPSGGKLRLGEHQIREGDQVTAVDVSERGVHDGHQGGAVNIDGGEIDVRLARARGRGAGGNRDRSLDDEQRERMARHVSVCRSVLE
jgi:hypothetical protein